MNTVAAENVSGAKLLPRSSHCPICDADLTDHPICAEHGVDFARCDHCDEVHEADELVHEADNDWWVCAACTDLCVDCGERKATTEDRAGNRICNASDCRIAMELRHQRAYAAAFVAAGGEQDDIPFAEVRP